MIDNQSKEKNDKVLGSEDKVNKEVTTNPIPAVDEAVVAADRERYWYLSDEQFQECVEKAKYPPKSRQEARLAMCELGEGSAEYQRCSALIYDSLQNGLRTRTAEEVKAMKPTEKKVYYACRDEEEYKYLNPEQADLPPEVKALVLVKEEADGWKRYFVPTREQVQTIKLIINEEVRSLDIIDKSQRHIELRQILKDYEKRYNCATFSGEAPHTQLPARSHCGVPLNWVYFCIPISTARKRIYQACFDLTFDINGKLELTPDESSRIDRLILSRCGCTASQNKLPVRYDLLKEAKMATPFRIDPDNEYMMRLLLAKDEDMYAQTAFKTVITPTHKNKRVQVEIHNTIDKVPKNPRLHNGIASLPLYARYYALEHVLKMDMLEAYFPMGDLQLMVRAAKCEKLLNAMGRELKAHSTAEEITLTESLKALFDCTRDLYLRKNVSQDMLRGLVVAVMNSAYEADMAAAKKPDATTMEKALGVTAEETLACAGEEANRLYEACKRVKLYDRQDFVVALRTFCKDHQNCVYAHDRAYVPTDAQTSLAFLKMDLGAQGLIWGIKGRSGSLTSEFNVDYEYFDTNRGMEERNIQKEIMGELTTPPSSGRELWLKSLLED